MAHPPAPRPRPTPPRSDAASDDGIFDDDGDTDDDEALRAFSPAAAPVRDGGPGVPRDVPCPLSCPRYRPPPSAERGGGADPPRPPRPRSEGRRVAT
eukprot:gene47738-46977_t